MTETGKPRSLGQRWNRAFLAAAIVLFLALLGWGGAALWRRAEAPRPPVVPLAGIDPAIAQAVRDGEEKVRQSPYSGPAWGSLGMTLYAHAFAGQAQTCFGEAERLDARNPRWPYLKGVCILQENPDPGQAVPELTRAVRLTGDAPDAPRLLLAETLLDLGRPGEAEPLLRQALAHDPDNARALLGLGRLALAQGRLAEAQRELQKSSQFAPGVKATLLLLAQTFQRLGNAAAAAQISRQAAALPDTQDWPDPYKEEALQTQVGKDAEVRRGAALVTSGQFAEAVRQMEQTTANYPTAGQAWMLLGAGYGGVGDMTDGEKALRRAVQLDPNSAESSNDLGDLLAHEGRENEAAQWFTKAVALNPQSADFHFNLGVCLYREHQTPGAVREFETAVRLNPNAVKTHAGLADALAQAGQTAAAIQQLHIGLGLSPHDPILEQSLAKLQGAAR